MQVYKKLETKMFHITRHYTNIYTDTYIGS